VTFDCRVEGYLPQFVTRIGVRLKQNVTIRPNENANRKFPNAQKDLCSRLVLTIKYLDLSLVTRLLCPPGKRYMKLWPSMDELFDQATNVHPNAAWVDSAIVMEVCQRQSGKAVIHST
jgi:hypothetical protein